MGILVPYLRLAEMLIRNHLGCQYNGPLCDARPIWRARAGQNISVVNIVSPC